MSGNSKTIEHNPPAGKVWLQERGAPYRSAHEFLQIAVDNKAYEEIFQKRILLLAKQSAEGVQSMYGRKYDFAQIKHVIKDAMILQRLDLPASMKPKVTRERAVFLKRVLNAALGFNIPLLVELMAITFPDVNNVDMTATGNILFGLQRQGGNRPPLSSKRLDAMRKSQLSRRQGAGEKLDPKRIRAHNIGFFFRALKVQHKVYGRNMGNVREIFYQKDIESMGTLSHNDFQECCNELGLGLTEEQITKFISAVDTSSSGVIGYDEILKPLHMEFSEFVEAEVPKKSKIVGMRRNERLKLLKENQLFWERNF